MEFEKQFVEFYIGYVYVMTGLSVFVNSLLAIVIYHSNIKNDRYMLVY